MKTTILILAAALGLSGCAIGTGRPRCNRFYGVAVPLVAVGVFAGCN